MTIKICHLTSAHTHQDIRIFYKECSSLSEFGYEVHLVAPGASERVQQNGVITHTVPLVARRFERMTKTVWRVFSIAKNVDANLYHFHDPELLLIGFLLKLCGKRVIYDVHEDVPRQILSMTWINKYFRKTASWCFEQIENFFAKRYDAIITATPAINQRFILLGCRAININNYPILTELYSDIDWDEKQAAVCYIGGISEVRGIYEMVKALANSGTKLKLAGKFSSIQCRSKVSELPGWAFVEELGQVGREAVKRILSESMAGLVLFHPEPNHIAAQPNKMFEYMSAGICLIASDFPLWREVIENNNCGICVDPLNVESIANAIQWVFNHSEDAKHMGQNGIRAVKEKYNWGIESKKLVDVYRELLSDTLMRH